MQLTQALLLALATVKFAQAIPQDFNANRFGGGNNGDNGQDQNNGGDQNNNGGDNGQDTGNNGGDNGQGGNQGGGNGGGNTCLDPNNIQDGSASPGEPDAAAGQSDSLTYVLQLDCIDQIPNKSQR
jgi:hypothetical protein